MKRLLSAIAAVFIAGITLLVMKNEYAWLLTRGENYGMQPLIDAQKRGDAEGVDLFLGSSVFRQGLDIQILVNRYSQNAYVLSYNGNQPFMEYMELDFLLKHGVRPESVCVDMYAMTLASEPELSDEKILMETDMAFKTALWNTIKPYQEKTISSAWDFFVGANNELILCWPALSSLINNRFYRGGNIVETGASSADKLDEMQYVIDGRPNQTQTDAIYSIIALCAQYHIPVLFIETPKWHTIHDSKEYIALMQHYVEILDAHETKYILTEATARQMRHLAGHTDTISFDATHAPFYQDGVHLSSEGRRVFTEELIEHLLR